MIVSYSYSASSGNNKAWRGTLASLLPLPLMRVGRWLPAAAAAVTKSTSVLSFTTKRSHNSITTSMSLAAPLIDVDCNLWHDELRSLKTTNQKDASFLTILTEDAVCESNIVAMLSPSSTIQEARMGLELLSSTQTLIPILTTVGIHPYHVNDKEGLSSEDVSDDDAVVESIKELMNHPFVSAVGECGLDATDGFPPLEDQLYWFRIQVQLAQQHGKLPLFVHERLAFSETINVLDTCTVPVLIHCFTGSKEDCNEYVKRGYSLSISGYIFKQQTETRACLVDDLIPLHLLMIETDAPYMGFENCRLNYLQKQGDFLLSLNAKKRKRIQNSTFPNVPSSLPLVLDEVVNCLNEGRVKRNQVLLERDEVARITTENAIRFFGFKGIKI
jgi:TatD DNase family protein